MRIYSPKTPDNTPSTHSSYRTGTGSSRWYFWQKGDPRRVAILSGESQGRVARQQLLQPEDQHRDKAQRRQDEGQPAEQKNGHDPEAKCLDHSSRNPCGRIRPSG